MSSTQATDSKPVKKRGRPAKAKAPQSEAQVVAFPAPQPSQIVVPQFISPPRTTPKVFLAAPAYGQTMTTHTVSTLMGVQRALDQAGYESCFLDKGIIFEMDKWMAAPDPAKSFELIARASAVIRNLTNWREMAFAGGFGTLSYPDIVEIRNIFTSIWYDKIQTSHMLFIDADMNFPPQLVLDMIASDRPLVGALCPKKKYPLEFAGRAKVGDAQVVNGFMEVSGVGGAIMMIRRDVITKMLEKFPEIDDKITVKNHAARDILEAQGVTRLIRAFDPISIEGEKFSEDLSFCHRWQACGGDVWASIMYKIGHVGLHEFEGCYYDMVKDHIKQSPAESVASVAQNQADLVPSLMAAE